MERFFPSLLIVSERVVGNLSSKALLNNHNYPQAMYDEWRYHETILHELEERRNPCFFFKLSDAGKLMKGNKEKKFNRQTRKKMSLVEKCLWYNIHLILTFLYQFLFILLVQVHNFDLAVKFFLI